MDPAVRSAFPGAWNELDQCSRLLIELQIGRSLTNMTRATEIDAGQLVLIWDSIGSDARMPTNFQL